MAFNSRFESLTIVDGDALLLFHEGRLWWPSASLANSLLAYSSPLAVKSAPVFVGRLASRPVFVAAAQPGDDAGVSMSLREVLLGTHAELALVAGVASQLLEWDLSHQFCGRCGATTACGQTERVRVCAACQSLWYPRLSPCVIVAVRRDDKVLLVRSSRHSGNYFSLVAGFVESGESIEQAVHREVLEETGLTLGKLRFIGSQSWPFPHQLMLGFIADYAGGECVFQVDEIAEGGWFRPEALPRVPPTASIAGVLIQKACAQIRRRRRRT